MSVLDRLRRRPAPAEPATPPTAGEVGILAANVAPKRRRYDLEGGGWVEDDRVEPDQTGAVKKKLYIVGPGWLDPDHLPE
jgi:hypothetical protein